MVSARKRTFAVLRGDISAVLIYVALAPKSDVCLSELDDANAIFSLIACADLVVGDEFAAMR